MPPFPAPAPAPAPSRTPSSSPTPAHALPSSRVLISPATPTKNSISLRYQPMTILDPSLAPSPPRKRNLDSAMTSSRHKSPPTRGFRPKTCPGPRNLLEAIPNSWASASRPSDLRPNPPSAPQASKASRPSPTPPTPLPTPPARPNTVRLRSKSADRAGTKNSVTGPRSPKRSLVVQPTPKRLSLGMVMDTAKLVSTPPASDLGSSISVPLSKPIVPPPPAATNPVSIRSLPASPNGSPCIARLPISGSHYKRELSPPPVLPVHRSTSPVSPPAFGPKPLPVPPSISLQPPIPPSPARPILHLNPTVPLSPFTPSPPSLPSSWSPKSPLHNASTSPMTATTTTTGTASSYISALSSDFSKYDEALHVKWDKSGESPASTWSSGHFAQQNDRGHHQEPHVQIQSIPDTEATIQPLPLSSPALPPPSSPIEEEADEEEEEPHDRLDNLDAYDWTLEEEQYDDQLFRIPVSPTSTTLSDGSDGPVLEVFVDNLYWGERDRSPSPITYARPMGSDYSDEEDSANGAGRRRRVRRRGVVNVDVEEEEEERIEGAIDDDGDDGVANQRKSPTTGNRKQHNNRNHLSSTMSYHSDDSSLYFTGNLPSRRRRREQLRSYRYSFRPPVSPTSATAATAVSSNTLAAFSPKGHGRTRVLGYQQRSPSPIEYARRRSLDGVYGFGSGDEVDEGGERRNVQPRSFLNAYSKPPDVTAFLSEERERGRRKERTLISVPIVQKERSKDKDGKEKVGLPRTRKGSRGFLDELAAVAVRNNNNNSTRRTNNNNNNNNKDITNTTPRTSDGSPPPPPPLPPLPFHSKERDRDEKEKEKEKEKKRKWVWELSKSDSSSKDKLVCPGIDGSSILGSPPPPLASGEENVLVLDIGNGNVSGGWGGRGNSSEGYQGWNAVWPDEDFIGGGGGGGGGNRKGRKQRHSLNGLEFV